MFSFSFFIADTQSNCTIHEVYIDPCKESAEGKPCKLKRGVVGNMTFHYTPCKYWYYYPCLRLRDKNNIT